MNWSLFLMCCAAVTMAATLSMFGRKDGLGGVRLGLVLLCGGASVVNIGLTGAAQVALASEALPWTIAVRIGIATLCAGGLGVGLILLWPDWRCTRRIILTVAFVLSALGAALTVIAGEDSLFRSEVSWSSLAPYVRLFDQVAIGGGTVILMIGAVTRIRRNERGRGAMLSILAGQIVATVGYFYVRLNEPYGVQVAASAGLVTMCGLVYWITIERWRVAGIGESGLSMVFERARLPAVVVDLYTDLCVLNPAAHAAVGRQVTPVELFGLLGLEAVSKLEPVLQRLDDQILPARTLPAAPGRIFDVQCHFSRQDRMGLFVLFDVTERVAQAQDLSSTVEKLREMQDRMVDQEKVAALGVLVAGVNHEINNPLSWATSNLRVVDTYLSALLRGVPLAQRVAKGDAQARSELAGWAEDPDVVEAGHDAVAALTEAQQGCAQIKEIVSSMRQLSRQQEQVDQVDLSALAAAGVKVAGTSLGPNVSLQVALETKLPARAVAGEVMRVVTNLVVNAGQALGQTGNVRVRSFAEGEEAVLEVEDDGPGVPEHLRQRVFDPFFTTKAPGKGTGLGLAISAETARRHGGRLLLVPRPGRGAVFQLRLPLRDAEVSDPQVPIVPSPLVGTGA